MELQEKQISDINYLLGDYDSRIADWYFISELLHILNDGEKFDIKYEYSNSKTVPVYTDVLNQTIYYNPRIFLKHMHGKVKKYSEKYPEIDEDYLYNFFVVESILREAVRVEQGHMAYNHIYSHEEISRLYRIFFDALNNRTFFEKLFCLRSSKNDFHERNADILASLIAANIYRYTEFQNIATNIYALSLFGGYGYGEECPAKTSLESVGLPYVVDKRGISFRDAFYNGLVIDTDNYNELVNFLQCHKRDAIEIDQKIRSLG